MCKQVELFWVICTCGRRLGRINGTAELKCRYCRKISLFTAKGKDGEAPPKDDTCTCACKESQ